MVFKYFLFLHRMSIEVNYSSIAPSALLSEIRIHFDFKKNATIRFLKRGFNDTYLITEPKGRKFILRVYNVNWRKRKSIVDELALLAELNEARVAVSDPYRLKGGAFHANLAAPEGRRYMALFKYAEGASVQKLTVNQAFLLGIETGRMHKYTEGKSYKYAAQNYEVDYQIRKSYARLKPILKDFPEEWAMMVKIRDDFYENFTVQTIPKLSRGVCHGDLQAENVHFTANNNLTLFDFDFFGNGFLIYDIGVFIWYDHQNKTKEIVDSFLKGYQTQRLLNDTELRLLPYFSTLRALFQMTVYCKLNNGTYLPQWKPEQVAKFVHKMKRWHETEVRKYYNY